MTTPRRDDTQEPWAAWVQRNPRLDSVRDGLCCTNSDLWVHKYRTYVDNVGTRELQHIMLIEVKTYGIRKAYQLRISKPDQEVQS